MKTEIVEIESECLKDNFLKDDWKRQILVYRPDDAEGGLPLFIELAGTNWRPRTHNKFSLIIEKLFSSGLKAVVLNPNFSTRYNMNQYLNSPAVGSYEDFIVKELIPYFKDKYGTDHTALFGKSSGGFGSYTLAARHPDIIDGFADHFGDSCFFYLYADDMAAAFRYIQRHGKSESVKMLTSHMPSDDEMKVLNVIGSSAFYSPDMNDVNGFDLPFDEDTGELIEDVWQRWVQFDPAKNVLKYSGALKKMKAIYLDVGTNDEYKLYIGTRALHKKLGLANIDHYYEEFNGGHFGNSERYLYSLPFLYRKLNDTA
ncbi:TVG1496158 [Thermoplasma volcanium GSS1]|uniref:TVG1496158 protein n=1 Tax=Thermoplasma volcanium (strain ATCC 51530 / DSM 4299 / JCM 9571 / NBRC 15438 / GSS1) TaxID=273116 RepID=Q978G8_THEVO|nr:alpha/beta hydrolase-fold protein [Thermoplasma volcanium]BAB60589.1 TVG1496158 [Thermoplasma volcanium GSS1]